MVFAFGLQRNTTFSKGNFKQICSLFYNDTRAKRIVGANGYGQRSLRF